MKLKSEIKMNSMAGLNSFEFRMEYKLKSMEIIWQQGERQQTSAVRGLVLKHEFCGKNIVYPTCSRLAIYDSLEENRFFLW